MPTNDEYNTLKAQRDLLFDGLKKLVRSDSTPDSIKTYLNTLAKKVVSFKSYASIAENNKPFEVGDVVMTANNKICRYKIEKMYEDAGTKYCTLRTVWVKDNVAPPDGVHHNIPLSFLKHYKGV
jgi:hypothetical protein